MLIRGGAYCSSDVRRPFPAQLSKQIYDSESHNKEKGSHINDVELINEKLSITSTHVPSSGAGGSGSSDTRWSKISIVIIQYSLWTEPFFAGPDLLHFLTKHD